MTDVVVTVGKKLWEGWLSEGDAVALTIPVEIKGFQGWRYRWWSRDEEVPFTDWRNP